MILHQYPAVWGMRSLSPFCIKLETYLRLRKIDYQVKVELNPGRGPKGKMPFVTFEGREIADSSFVIQELFPEDQLSPMDIAYRSLIEETLYFVLLYSRWVDEDGYRIAKREFSKLFPSFLGQLATPAIRRDLLRQAKIHGISRHLPSEVDRIAQDGMASVAERLGDVSYFAGASPGQIDCIAFGFLQTVYRQPIESVLKETLLRNRNLVNFVHRMEKAFDMFSAEESTL